MYTEANIVKWGSFTDVAISSLQKSVNKTERRVQKANTSVPITVITAR